MKKLNLKLEGVKEMLTKEEMKQINGGNNYCGACINAVGQWSGGCSTADITTYCSSGEGLCYVC
jgi:hypothetical protein